MISYETNNSYCPHQVLQKNIGRSLRAHVLLTRAHRKIQAHKSNFDTLRHYVTPISNRNEKRTLKPTRIHLKYLISKLPGGECWRRVNHIPPYFKILANDTLASIPGRTSSEDGPGIDCLRMR